MYPRTIFKLTGLTRIAPLRLWGWRLLKRTKINIPLPMQGMWLSYFSLKYIFDGIYEPETTLYLRNTIRPGKVFVDVGANIGYFSILAAKLGATVYAFEPSPKNYEALSNNVRTNKVNIFTLQSAVSNHDGYATFHVREGGSTTDSLLKLYSDAMPTKVRVSTLDTTLPSHVDYIKIDTEGADLSVLQGAEDTLKNNPHCIIIIEYSRLNFKNETTPEQFLQTLKDMQFTVQVAEPNGTLREPTHEELFVSERYINLFLKRV